MKQFIILFTLLIAVTITTNAQTPTWLWAKATGGLNNDFCNDIAHDALGNVYTTGYFSGTVDFNPGAGIFNLTSAGNYDIFICKLDGLGNFVWAKAMKGTGSEFGVSISVDTSGNVYISGEFNGTVDFNPDSLANYNLTSVGNYDIFISKLNTSGNFVWAKAIGGINSDYNYSIALDGYNNVYTTGFFNGTVDFDPSSTGSSNLTSAGANDIYVLKLDGNGNFVWAKAMGGTGNYDYGQSITLDLSGNIYITGEFGGTADFNPGAGIYNLTASGIFDIFISKLDNSGNFIWAKRMGGTGAEYVYSIAIDASGYIYTTGSFFGMADFDTDSTGVAYMIAHSTMSDIFISKIDNSGNYVWVQQIGSTDGDCAYSVALDVSGNVYTTGYFGGTVDFDPGPGTYNLIATPGSVDIFISRLSGSGSFVWAKAIGGASYDQGQSIDIDASGIMYLAGNFKSPSFPVGSDRLTNADTTSLIVWDMMIAKLNTVLSSENYEIENFSKNISIFPNPATDIVTLNIDNRIIAGLTLNIYNVAGQLVRSEILKQNQQHFHVGDLNNGVYLVVIKSKEWTEKQKLLIQK